MSRNSKKSMGWTIVLILLGLVALFGGEKWLVAADSCRHAGLVRRQARLAEWPELTAGATIETCHLCP